MHNATWVPGLKRVLCVQSSLALRGTLHRLAKIIICHVLSALCPPGFLSRRKLVLHVLLTLLPSKLLLFPKELLLAVKLGVFALKVLLQLGDR